MCPDNYLEPADGDAAPAEAEPEAAPAAAGGDKWVAVFDCKRPSPSRMVHGKTLIIDDYC